MKAKGRPRAFDRDQALARAMEVFWVRGFEGASLAELTQAMGINPPSLYAAFGCKEQLFHEAVELYTRTEGTEIWPAVASAASARAAVYAFLRQSALSFSRPDKPAGCLIVLSGLHSADTHPAVAAALRDHRADNVEQLREMLDKAVAAGELPAGIDTTAIATFYATVQQGMSIQARDGADRATLLGVADAAMASWSALTSPPTARIRAL